MRLDGVFRVLRCLYTRLGEVCEVMRWLRVLCVSGAGVVGDPV